MRRYITFPLILTASVCTTKFLVAQSARDENGYVPPSISVDYPSPGFRLDREELDQARRGGFVDYQQIVKAAANKKPEALKKFFQASATAPWDAAGGEQHQSTMCQMLLLWGDRDFSVVLASMPKSVRTTVVSRIKDSAKSFELLFPLTAKLE